MFSNNKTIRKTTSSVVTDGNYGASVKKWCRKPSFRVFEFRNASDRTVHIVELEVEQLREALVVVEAEAVVGGRHRRLQCEERLQLQWL